jgi:hypothetical protein
MTDKSRLSKELAAAAERCFDTADRLAVYTEMNLGNAHHAIDDIIWAVVREDYPMPATLINELREWLANDPIDDYHGCRDDLAQRVSRVRTI